MLQADTATAMRVYTWLASYMNETQKGHIFTSYFPLISCVCVVITSSAHLLFFHLCIYFYMTDKTTIDISISNA